MFEAWLQLRGEAPADRQIATTADRHLALTHNLGGYPGEMVSFVSILGTELGADRTPSVAGHAAAACGSTCGRPRPTPSRWSGRSPADRLTWSVANRSDAPVAVDAVAVVARLDRCVEPLRVLRHGYQSWSPTAVATFRRRPGPDPRRRRAVAADRHAPRRLGAGRGRRAAQRAGHRAARRHRRRARGRVPRRVGARRHVPRAAAPATAATASSSGSRRSSAAPCCSPASAASCTRCASPTARATRRRCWRTGPAALGRGRRSARTTAPYQVGWCSWYHYFHARHRGRPARRTWPWPATGPSTCSSSTTASSPPSATGSTTNDKFPTPVDGLAAAIARRGPHARASGSRRSSPAPTREVARAHPDWLAHPPRRPARRWSAWPTRRGAARSTRSTPRNPEVLDHLESVARDLVDGRATRT